MTDLRKYARRTKLRMLIGLGFLILVVGEGLIYLLYGQGAAVMGLLCLGGAVLPVAAVVVVLTLLDRLVSSQSKR